MAYIDPVRASPNNYRSLLENDHVRVLEMTLRAGEPDETHSHLDETADFVKGASVRIHLPDGHVMWHEAWTHRVENTGTSDLLAIIVESKQGSYGNVCSRAFPSVPTMTRSPT